MSLAESPEVAVIREAKEETGLDVDNPTLIDVVSNVDFDEAGQSQVPLCHHRLFGACENRRLLKLQAMLRSCGWVPFDEVEEYNLTASFRVFFRHNREKLEKASSY